MQLNKLFIVMLFISSFAVNAAEINVKVEQVKNVEANKTEKIIKPKLLSKLYKKRLAMFTLFACFGCLAYSINPHETFHADANMRPGYNMLGGYNAWAELMGSDVRPGDGVCILPTNIDHCSHAIAHGIDDLIKYCINKIDINADNLVGCTLLMNAVQYASIDVIKQLLSNPFIDVSKEGNSVEVYGCKPGYSAYEIAQIENRTDVAQLIKAHPSYSWSRNLSPSNLLQKINTYKQFFTNKSKEKFGSLVKNLIKKFEVPMGQYFIDECRGGNYFGDFKESLFCKTFLNFLLYNS